MSSGGGSGVHNQQLSLLYHACLMAAYFISAMQIVVILDFADKLGVISRNSGYNNPPLHSLPWDSRKEYGYKGCLRYIVDA